MVYHVAFYRLRAAVTPEKLEEMIRSTRSQLIRVPEVLTVRSGKKLDPSSEWPFFVALDFESLGKMAYSRADEVERLSFTTFEVNSD
jgi:hypothetical protein